ncbi:SAM-dependent methyltransferase [Actinocrispum wychmicini]|uniref:S-adenosyl methyltransferase n=1 Tax=Actinocrispum wychmicini TaxID=1213861 RepID=A0A4R2JHU4_9PSEU|nr:SAM-dependent methyltransferase [Actinocrispum wychmicini]TCO53695.1 S-adenosyl methyltransferase [Actinocrispum wychmicini]
MTTRGDDSRATPVRIDTARPSIIRVYDAMLGGKDNFQADRDVRDKLLALDPEFGRASWDIREFTMRVTRFLAGDIGVGQFVDLGAILPTSENTHEVAQRLNREATMVYVAMDHAVLAHGRALLADNDRTHMAEADFRQPQQVIENTTVAKYIDFDVPMALFLVGTMHHVSDRRDPAGIVAAYIDAMPSGSYLALAQMSDPGPDHELAPLAQQVTEVYRQAGFPCWLRTPDQAVAMMAGLELLEPGMVTLADWWPDGPRLRPLSPVQRLVHGAVGRKP